MVLACSALKKSYRELLLSSDSSPDRHAVAVVRPLGTSVPQLKLPLKYGEQCSTYHHLLGITVLRSGLSLQIALQPSREELERRLKIRSAGGMHYMPPSLLDSQLADQESDPDAMFFGEHPSILAVHELIHV